MYRYKNEERNATMTILDIGLLTGYTVNKDDLNKVRLTHTFRVQSVFVETGCELKFVCVCLVVQRICPYHCKV